MGLSHRTIGLLAIADVAVALLLSLTIRPSAGLSFLSGSLLGAASLGAVTLRVWLLTGGRAQNRRWWRVLAVLFALPYYVVLAAILWAIAHFYPQAVPWLLVGYIFSLAAFAKLMWRRRRVQVDGACAEIVEHKP